MSKENREPGREVGDAQNMETFEQQRDAEIERVNNLSDKDLKDEMWELRKELSLAFDKDDLWKAKTDFKLKQIEAEVRKRGLGGVTEV